MELGFSLVWEGLDQGLGNSRGEVPTEQGIEASASPLMWSSWVVALADHTAPSQANPLMRAPAEGSSSHPGQQPVPRCSGQLLQQGTWGQSQSASWNGGSGLSPEPAISTYSGCSSCPEALSLLQSSCPEAVADRLPGICTGNWSILTYLLAAGTDEVQYGITALQIRALKV